MSCDTADHTLNPKVVFLNSVFLFAGIVAFVMGFFRWQVSMVMGSIDFVFSLCGFALIYYLNRHKERVETLSSIALLLSYGLFTTLYLFAPYNTTRISLFFLLSASIFFLKGRRAGLGGLIIILLTIVTVHFLSGFDTAYSHIDIITTSLYLMGFIFILINYEKFKEKVNERDRDKEVLRLSEERFRTMIESGNDIICIISNTGTIRFISPSVESILGFTPDEMTSEYMYKLIHTDEQSKVATALANALTHPGGETLEKYEFRMKHKDGSYRDIEMVGRNLISNPVIGGIVLSGRDITARKQADEDLRASERKFMQFFMQVPISLGVLNKEGVIVYFNDWFTKVIGYTTDDVPTLKEWWQLAYPDESYRQRVLRVWGAAVDKAALAGTDIEPNEYRVTCKGGAERIFIIGGIPLEGNILATFIDITERKLAEEQIHRLNEGLETKVKERTKQLQEAQEKLEIKVQERTKQLLEAQEELVRKEKLALLGQVAVSVGHELRNPLGVMNNAVYFLQTVLSDADESTKEYLNIIKSEIAGSERIVSTLLDSVRTKPPQIQTVGITELIEQTLRNYVMPSSVTVKLDIPATLPPLQVDPMQIQQVLRDLISNGVEAMPEGGTLEIQAVENKQDGTVSISVRDSGIGMAPEVLAKLFQPLFTTKARGIGLGLVVVKNLTQANGGSVKVQSEVGKGTLFTVTLPVADERGIST